MAEVKLHALNGLLRPDDLVRVAGSFWTRWAQMETWITHFGREAERMQAGVFATPTAQWSWTLYMPTGTLLPAGVLTCIRTSCRFTGVVTCPLSLCRFVSSISHRMMVAGHGRSARDSTCSHQRLRTNCRPAAYRNVSMGCVTPENQMFLHDHLTPFKAGETELVVSSIEEGCQECFCGVTQNITVFEAALQAAAKAWILPIKEADHHLRIT